VVYGIGLPTIQYQSMLIPTVCHPTQSQNLSTSNIAGGDRATKSQGLPYNHLKPSCLPPLLLFSAWETVLPYIYIYQYNSIYIYIYLIIFVSSWILQTSDPKTVGLVKTTGTQYLFSRQSVTLFWGGPKASAFPKSVRDWVEVAGVVGVDSLARKMPCVSGQFCSNRHNTI